MRIADVMTHIVQCVSPQATLEQAARIMNEHDVGVIPVAVDDKPGGMLTDRDIVVRAIAQNRDPRSTPVSEIMSPQVVACRQDESIDAAVDAMERHRVRRLVVTDEADRICGVVSLGDLAMRTEQEDLAEEVLEEVSWPGHAQRGGQGAARLMQRSPTYPRRAFAPDSRSVISPINGIVLSFAAGMLMMYMLDPARGPRRRAMLRDKIIHAKRIARDRLGKTTRYARGRAVGLLHDARSVMQREDVSDEQLRERVRSALGRVVSHPHAIHVSARDGVVTLTGPILARELNSVISTVSRVRGVRKVEDFLDPHERRGREPSLQGGIGRPGPRSGIRQEYWAPTTQALGLLGGGALLAWSLRQRGLLGLAGSAAGVALAARSITNMPMRRLVGIGAGRRAVDIQKDININAPVEKVFEYFANYQNFPRFMSCVREVRDLGGGRSHWVVAGPAGVNVSWDAELTLYEPNKLLAWRSLPGSTVENAGIMRFEPNGKGGTRVDIKLSYNPPGGALGHAIASLFGADAKHEMNADLLRFKTMIETGHPPYDAAKPAAAEPQPEGIAVP